MLKQRHTLKNPHPNPLFEGWLKEWRDEAIETNSKKQHCYEKALKSLQKYPLPLQSGRDCIILQGFGEKLCRLLDEKLTKHNKSPSKTEKSKEYVPVIRSGAWSILLTLYKKSLEAEYTGYMLKTDLIKHAQNLCDKSFVRPDPGGFYTAWSTMKTLIDKHLVTKNSSPAKYSLTDDGVLLAYKLYRNHISNDVSPQIKPVNKPSNKKADSLNQIHLEPPQKSKRKLKKATSFGSLTSETSQETSSSLHEESLMFLPGSFDIVLLVDKMEVRGNNHPVGDATLAGLTHLNVKYEVRHLKVGDYTWICRERGDTNKELILPYIVERKRMDDLGSSIKDGRFHEQKFRLKQCGIRNVVYLIESYGSNTHTGLPLSCLYQAATNTLVHDGFSVKFTGGTKDTIKYFATMTNILNVIYLNKTLASCPKENIEQGVDDDDLVSLMTFHEFNKEAEKNKNLKVQDVFVRMLLQLKGMSVDKALAIVEKYPTPQHLKIAYDESTLLKEELLADLRFGKLNKKIGPSISKVICQLFTKECYS